MCIVLFLLILVFVIDFFLFFSLSHSLALTHSLSLSLSIYTKGAGTHVLPTSGGECIKVGGSISTERNIQVFNQVSTMHCDIVYKGSSSESTGLSKWKTNGEVRQDTTLDLSEYEKMKTVLAKKSQYWSTLPSTGQVIYESWGNPTGQTTYKCGTEDVQVFNILPEESETIIGVHTIYFSKSCLDKTILINIHGDGNVKIDAAAMHYESLKGYGPGGFPTCITSSLLWNFPDASSVNIGNGKTSEFHGSILVTGDMTLSTSGQSGRTMVLGDIFHDSPGSGSEFHSYEFNPPTPLPDPNDICVDSPVTVEGGTEDDDGSSCACETNTNDDKQSWKCGNHIYVCPDVTDICSVTGSQNSIYYSITQDQCNAMKPIKIGDKCIELPQHGITSPKGLSNRVCYSRSEHGMKEDGSCDICKDSETTAFYKLVVVADDDADDSDAAMEAPPDPTESPTRTPLQSQECTAIPQDRLPAGSWKTDDNSCNICKPPNNKKWYPCNKNPPICEGNCVFK
jgi:choice-of-anchor A domain-containing protein